MGNVLLSRYNQSNTLNDYTIIKQYAESNCNIMLDSNTNIKHYCYCMVDKVLDTSGSASSHWETINISKCDILVLFLHANAIVSRRTTSTKSQYIYFTFTDNQQKSISNSNIDRMKYRVDLDLLNSPLNLSLSFVAHFYFNENIMADSSDNMWITNLGTMGNEIIHQQLKLVPGMGVTSSGSLSDISINCQISSYDFKLCALNKSDIVNLL